MDYISKFKINGIVVACENLELKTKDGNVFTLKKINVEQEVSNGRYIKKDVFEVQIDFEKEHISEGDTVEIVGFIKSNPSKDGAKHFMALVGTKCNVIYRPNVKPQTLDNDEQSKPNPCLKHEDDEDYPF